MRHRHSFHSFTFYALTVIALCAAQSVFAQTTMFAFQGKLDFDGVPANGQFDFQFKLFDSLSAGAQQGATIEQLTVDVTNGAYSVNLDFGAAVFTGADRFLEVSFRPTGSTPYTTLTPRQQIVSVPYAVRSLVATTADGLSVTCASCVTSSQIQGVQGSQVTGNIAGNQISGLIPVASVPAGSGNYIQNTTSQQPNSNFNISGDGAAGGTLSSSVVNANTQYNLGGLRVLGSGGPNLFVGINAGSANAGGYNSFFGTDAGRFNTMGNENSFFGSFAGRANTTGNDNSFFGMSSGFSNMTGSDNSFFGDRAGTSNTSGGGNSFFGRLSGYSNTTGVANSVFGSDAGVDNTSGISNTFVGFSSGFNNTTGSKNTFIGRDTHFSSAGANGDNNTLLGYFATIKSGVSNATAIGANAQATASHTVVLGTDQEAVIVPGKLEVDTLAVAGNQHLCLNNNNRLAPCSSSLRYKTDLWPFAAGMEIIKRLQPVSFTWKDGGMRDLGFGAEDVQKIEPLLVTTNAQGLVEGVKYDRIAVVLVNAVKEQQLQIAGQQTQIEQQRSQIDRLKKLVCLEHPSADICK